MVYRVEFSKAAERQFKKLPRPLQIRLTTRIDSLAKTPRPHGSVKLSGSDVYRIRVQDYRIIYQVRDKILLVLVLGVGHRREIYRVAYK